MNSESSVLAVQMLSNVLRNMCEIQRGKQTMLSANPRTSTSSLVESN